MEACELTLNTPVRIIRTFGHAFPLRSEVIFKAYYGKGFGIEAEGLSRTGYLTTQILQWIDIEPVEIIPPTREDIINHLKLT